MKRDIVLFKIHKLEKSIGVRFNQRDVNFIVKRLKKISNDAELFWCEVGGLYYIKIGYEKNSSAVISEVEYLK